MPGTSKKTVVVGVRLLVDTAKRARANVAARVDKGEAITLSQYLGRILEKQIGRKR